MSPVDIEKRRAYQRSWAAKNKDKIRGYFEKNKEERVEKMREYNRKRRHIRSAQLREERKLNPEKFRREDLMKNYGLSLEEYEQMHIRQAGKCKICGLHESNLDTRLHVDHDHVKQHVRGLLCRACNFLIGLAKDDIEILSQAILYLQETQ